ncbi:MAG TPA: peptidase M28, partial [Allosphingosinicella sp.]
GDTVDKMDFPYLTKVVKLNVAALAALASAPQPPEPTVEGGVSTDTTLTWNPVKGAESYIVRWRPTDSPNWADSLRVTYDDLARCPGRPAPPNAAGDKILATCSKVLKDVRVDDFVFGVSAVSKDGFESPVASAVPGGAFRPYSPPPPAP